MNNNKGFTLVELLAVIVILIGISLVTVTAISVSLERRDEKECKEQIELAKNAAKIYFSLNPDGVEDGVEVEILKDYYYLSEVSKTDRLEDEDIVKYEDGTFNYYGNGKCREEHFT